jgi:hypothetical protein
VPHTLEANWPILRRTERYTCDVGKIIEEIGVQIPEKGKVRLKRIDML